MATQAIQREQKKLLGRTQPSCVHYGRIQRVITPDSSDPANFYGFLETEGGQNVYFHHTEVNGEIKPREGDLALFFILRASGKVNDRAIEIDIVRSAK